jgi:hypothetical protein
MEEVWLSDTEHIISGSESDAKYTEDEVCGHESANGSANIEILYCVNKAMK